MRPQDRIIVALDVPSGREALELVEHFDGLVRFFKVGLQLFTAEGPQIVHEIVAEGGAVFLDLKLHDIPNTVAAAVREAARIGVDMLTIHTLGGGTMLSHASRSAAAWARQSGKSGPLLLGVTILTSMDQESLNSVGIDRSVDAEVLNLARSAWNNGLRGIVCSPREISLIRESGLDEIRIVTPGIRPKGAPKDDQARTLTPEQAVERGADYLVIGRPITNAPVPREAFASIVADLADSS